MHDTSHGDISSVCSLQRSWLCHVSLYTEVHVPSDIQLEGTKASSSPPGHLLYLFIPLSTGSADWCPLSARSRLHDGPYPQHSALVPVCVLHPIHGTGAAGCRSLCDHDAVHAINHVPVPDSVCLHRHPVDLPL